MSRDPSPIITSADMAAIEARVAEIEAAFGIEVVTIAAPRADVYPETVWKAFALGASLTGLVVVLRDFLQPAWTSSGSVLWSALAILGVGATWALGAVLVPAVTRAFLRSSRAEVEVAQAADVQFLKRELFATPRRSAVLIFVSLLERRVVIRADRGLEARVSVAQWDAVIASMRPTLRRGAPGTAMLDGLSTLREQLGAAGLQPMPGANRFGDRPAESREP